MDTLRGTAHNDRTPALTFVREAFAKWRDEGVIRAEQFDLIDAAHLESQRQAGGKPSRAAFGRGLLEL